VPNRAGADSLTARPVARVVLRKRLNEALSGGAPVLAVVPFTTNSRVEAGKRWDSAIALRIWGRLVVIAKMRAHQPHRFPPPHPTRRRGRCYLCPFSRMMAMRRSVTGSRVAAASSVIGVRLGVEASVSSQTPSS
jgi:hypothetical protein